MTEITTKEEYHDALRDVNKVNNTEGYLTPPSFNYDSRRDSLFDDDLSTSTTSKLSVSTSRLLSLPTDILLVLADHLPAPSTISLRLTCQSLHRLIPAPVKPPETAICLLTAANRHRQSLEDSQDSRHRCALCKSLYPTELFHRATILSPSLAFTNFASPSSILSVPEEADDETQIATGQSLSQMSDASLPVAPPRICAWHINRFVFPPSAALAPDALFDALVSAAGKADLTSSTHHQLDLIKARVADAGWASSVEKTCMHCGCVVACVCSVGDCGMCGCDCDGCGVREVRCWWKLARRGYGAGHAASFEAARRKWLIARAEEMERFGWDGKRLRAEGLLDWGMVRIVKCRRAEGLRVVEGSRKRRAGY
ncbi:hypothetical protein C1H76_4764 [Elsinoe australis]|uniref:F-box domain-containing protein n=1 Tax=Elsinoe australis TaxID=40998 RepID=A0A4U7B094_9PEZI|nr:hypothetical protein C1H76_4764 [Elsinoe australis]